MVPREVINSKRKLANRRPQSVVYVDHNQPAPAGFWGLRQRKQETDGFSPCSGIGYSLAGACGYTAARRLDGEPAAPPWCGGDKKIRSNVSTRLSSLASTGMHAGRETGPVHLSLGRPESLAVSCGQKRKPMMNKLRTTACHTGQPLRPAREKQGSTIRPWPCQAGNLMAGPVGRS